MTTTSIATASLKSRPEAPIAFGPGLGVHSSRAHYSADASERSARARVPNVDSIAAVLAHFAEVAPARAAAHFIDFEERVSTVTHAELLEHARRTAASFAARGVARGDGVILCFDTGLALVASFLGCALLGAVPVLIEMPLGVARTRVWSDTVTRMARLAGARALVVDEGFRGPAEEVAAACGLPLLTQADFVASGPVPDLPPTSAEDLAFIQFSSGTTGAPKGVPVTQRALFANARAIGDGAGFLEDDLMAGWLPLYHDMGLVGVMLSSILHGIPFVVMSPLAFLFRPERWIWAMHHFRATLTTAPNFAYQLCAKRITAATTEALDLSSLRLAFNGAELVQRETLAAFTSRFAPHGLRPTAMYPVYGMAEAGLGVAFPEPGSLPHEDPIDRDALAAEGRAVPAPKDGPSTVAFVSVGKALTGYEIRIVGHDGAPLGDRRQGEIVLRGPSFTGTYVNAPEDTARAFRDGWFYTGDLGYTVSGELFVCGRAKELIIKAGRNYHPHAFEISASRVEGVRVGCVAALGLRNAGAGTEDIAVVFETRATDPSELDALRRAVEAQIHRDVGLRPERVLAVRPQTLPKTSSGKIARSAVHKLLLAGELEAPAAPRG